MNLLSLTLLNFVVIDDELESKKTLVEYLESYGIKKVFAFDHGQEAIRFCSNHPVDFIICDWEMPEMNGLEVLKEVRKHPTLQKTPFMMVTSPISTEQMKILGAALYKVDSYLIKPFKPALLLEKILETLIDSKNKAKKTVILVDDDENVRSLVADILADMGFDPVLQSARAQVGFQLLQDHLDQVAVVVSDWEMPEMTGLEFLHKVRTTEKLKETPFVIITSQTSLEVQKIKQAADASVDSYLVKPFTVETLQQKVTALLADVRKRDHYELQILLADQALSESNLEEASHHYLRALEFVQKSFAANLGLAQVEMSRKPTRNLKEAIHHYQEALRCEPQSVATYIELAVAFEYALAPEKAAHSLKDAIQKCAPDARLHFNLGRLYSKRGKIEEAIPQLQKAIELEPNHSEAAQLLENAMMIKPIFKKK